jgi:hypothetical protein
MADPQQTSAAFEPHEKQSRMKQELGFTRRTGGKGGINIETRLPGHSPSTQEVGDADPQAVH